MEEFVEMAVREVQIVKKKERNCFALLHQCRSQNVKAIRGIDDGLLAGSNFLPPFSTKAHGF